VLYVVICFRPFALTFTLLLLYGYLSTSDPENLYSYARDSRVEYFR